MDIIRENEARYLKQEQRRADMLTMEQLHNIEIEWESIQPALMMDLESVLLDLYQKYAKIEIEGLVGAVSYVQFSYLRSALLDKAPCYRVDLYDERWVAADVECSSPWNPQFAFEKVNIIWEKLKQDFERQSYAPGYRLEEIILELADQFHWKVLHALYKTIPSILQSTSLAEKFAGVRVYGGEYYDRFYLLYDGGNAD